MLAKTEKKGFWGWYTAKPYWVTFLISVVIGVGLALPLLWWVGAFDDIQPSITGTITLLDHEHTKGCITHGKDQLCGPFIPKTGVVIQYGVRVHAQQVTKHGINQLVLTPAK